MKTQRIITAGRSLPHDPRRGSTLLIVVALLGMLAFLGFVFYTFSAQERSSAEYYAEAARNLDDPGLDVDTLWDWALEQLTVGPDYQLKNSALWGGRTSLVPNMYGTDLNAYDGTGVNLTLDANGLPVVDQDRDGSADPQVDFDLDGTLDGTYLEFNDSPAAQTAEPLPIRERRLENLPLPDVDYTYPDINNVALAYNGFTLGFNVANPGDPFRGTQRRVLIPSFHRPQYLRRFNGMSVEPIRDWAVVDWTASPPTSAIKPSQVMRPHPFHRHVATGERRFLDDTNPADAALIAGLPGASGGFPFRVHDDDDDLSGTIGDAGDIPNEQGVFSLTTTNAELGVTSISPAGPPPRNIISEFDSDNDGDGEKEGIWLDLDFPVQERESDGALYVPLFSPTIYDADGLLNLNAVGNLAGDVSLGTGTFGGVFGYGPDGEPGQAGVDDDGMNGVDDIGELGLAGTDDWGRISRSNDGLSPAEINPLWAFDAHPTYDSTPAGTPVSSVTAQHNFFFNNPPNSQDELANMEWLFLNKGRPELSAPAPSSVTDLHVGRYGEPDRLYDAATGSMNPLAFPFPGYSADANGVAYDDNSDRNEGGVQNQNLGNLGQTLPFVHPLSFDGNGRAVYFRRPEQLSLIAPFTTDPIRAPNRWLAYVNYGLGGDVKWNRTLGTTAMMPAASLGKLVNDPLETTLEPDRLRRPIDEPFSEEDMAYLHLSATDISTLGTTSRIKELMPANMNTENNTRAYDIKRRFTTSGWDRKQSGFSPFKLGLTSLPPGTGLDQRPGIAGSDDDGNSVIDDAIEFGWPGSDDDQRAWEFNSDTDRRRNNNNGPLVAAPDGRPEFPPQFPGALAYSPADPFRPQVRRLLEFELDEQNEFKLRFKLSVNEILDVTRRPSQQTGDERDRPLEFRPLTPHAVVDPNANGAVDPQEDANSNSVDDALEVGTVPSSAPFPPTSLAEREFWARYDRQRLARDIYVLLYTLCGGNDSKNYTRTNDHSDTFTPGNTSDLLYDRARVREMAQFAVNLVDTLDPDDVCTKFEYDKNLGPTPGGSSGWNLNDNPDDNDGFTPLPPANPNYDPGFPEDSIERGVVFGVEAQQLTFSEALWVKQDQLTMDHPATLFNESTLAAGQSYHFLQVELRNASAFPVKLGQSASTTAATGVWRVRRDDNNNGQIDVAPMGFDNAVTFLSSAGTVAEGGLFTMATGDNYGTDQRSVDFRVDYDLDADFDLISPIAADSSPVATTVPINPHCDLDLVQVSHATGHFELDNGAVGEFLNATTGVGVGNTHLVLERRMNPSLPGLSLALNPWVPIDTITISPTGRRPGGQYGLLASDTTQPLIETFLRDDVRSQERSEPLRGGIWADAAEWTAASPAMAHAFNSLMQRNSNTTGFFTQFQPHFDRDFASAGELLAIPLKAPAAVTRTTVQSNLAPDRQFPPTSVNGPFVAGARILQPLHPQGVGPDGQPGVASVDDDGNTAIDDISELRWPGSDDANDDNRWYRLFEFVEVPTRTHRQLGDPLQVKRVPGKINVNTVRHPEVFAGLLDDPDVFHRPERDFSLPPSVPGTLDPIEDHNGNGQWDYGLANNDVNGEPSTDPNRDWWWNLLMARDGVDPIAVDPNNASAFLMLPGTASTDLFGSHPFRSFSHIASGGGSIENTLFRRLPTSPAGRRLFELGSEDDHNNDRVQFYNRQRLLSKIMNNATTRSNVFIVFLTVEYFEAVETAAGAIRIGGKLDLDNNGNKDDDGHRGFFIIDRSEAEKAYDPGSRNFDWRKLVKHRLTIN